MEAKKAIDRIPKNLAAERAVLAGICRYGQNSWCEIQDIVDSTIFTDTDNKIIFSCIKQAVEGSDKIDISSVISAGTSLGYAESLNSKDQKEYIRSLFAFPIEKENVRKQAIILKKLDVARKGQELVKNIYNSLSSITGSEGINEIVSKLESPLLNFSTSLDNDDSDKTVLIMDGMQEFLDYIEENGGGLMGIPSPFARYNEFIGGGRRRGGVYLVGARPKVGKSTMALNDALHVAAMLKIPVLYLDTEMSQDAQRPRVMANLAKIKIKDIESGSFKDNQFNKTKLQETVKANEKIPFYYRKISGKPFDEILGIIRRWVTQDVGIDQETGRTKDCIVIYDYFKLMSADSVELMQEYQALGFQISALADFLGKYDITCQAYVQLNRDGISKETSDIISQSDRLLWLCASFAILKRKTQEEIEVDGVENGNTKLIPTVEQRFGPGMDEGDYINLFVDRDKCIMIEGKTKSEIKVNKSEGFDVVEDGYEDEEVSDEEFNKVDYGDDQYRKDSGLWKSK